MLSNLHRWKEGIQVDMQDYTHLCLVELIKRYRLFDERGEIIVIIACQATLHNGNLIDISCKRYPYTEMTQIIIAVID
jgi:hypothetical protein